MNLFGKSFPARRTLFALAIAIAFTSLTAGAHAQSIAQVDQALAYLFPLKTGFTPPSLIVSGSTVLPTAAQLQAAFQLIASGTGTLVTAAGHSAHDGLGDPQDVAQDIALVSGTLGAQSGDTFQVDMLAGYYAATSSDNALLTEYLPSVTAAAAAYGNFTSAEADLAESTIVGDAITDSKTQLAAILDAALAVTDPLPSAQAALFYAKATTTNLNNASLTFAQLATDLGGTTDIGGGVLTSGSTGAFLEAVLKADAVGTSQTAFLEGYVSGAVPSGLTAAQLATTATNIIAAAPSTFSSATRISVFTGLTTSGTTAGLSLAAVLPGITTGILVGQDYGANATANDTAITTLVDGATGMINAYPAEANLIAQYAAKTLQAPDDDIFAFTSGVLSNTNVKSSGGTNGIVDVTQAISDDFTLSDITATGGSIQAKEGAVEAGIKALSSAQVLSGSAAQIVSQAAAQVLTTSTSNSALVTFATNFITAVDTKNTNDPAITAGDRAYAAIGLAQAADAHGIVGASTAIAAAAVATYDTSILDLNDVAQPILQTFSTISGTETGAMAAAISQLGGTYTLGTTMYNYTPAYVAAQLVLAAKNGTTPIFTLADQIALGTAASSAILTGTFGGSATPNYGGSKDTYLGALAANLDTVTALPFLKNIATYLSATPPYTDTEIVADFATGLTSVSASVSAVSGTIAAVVSGSNPSDAAAIAHAAAANVNLDSVRYTIAEDVTKNVGASVVAISGSVADTITGVAGSSTYTQGFDLAVLTHDLVSLNTSVSVDSAIALNAANALPSLDPGNPNANGFEADLANIVKNAVPTTNGTFNKWASNITIVADNVAQNYNASLSGTSDSLGAYLGGYTNTALFAKDVLAQFPAVTVVAGAPDLSDDLADALVPQLITANSGSPATAASIAAQFTVDLPNSSVAIATAATESSLYISSPLTAEQSGTIGAAIASSLPTTAAFATKIPALSGSIAFISAEAAAPPATAQASINTAVQDVAGVFASYVGSSGTVQGSAYTDVAESLGMYALSGTTGSPTTAGINNALHSLTIPSIFEAFASPATLGSTATTAEVWLTKLIKYGTAGDLGDIWNAADIYGVALQADSALQVTTIETALETSIAGDIGALASSAGWQALIAADNAAGKGAFFGDTASTTLTTLKAQLDTLLAKAAAAAETGLNYNPAGGGGYGSITANETPVVNM